MTAAAHVKRARELLAAVAEPYERGSAAAQRAVIDSFMLALDEIENARAAVDEEGGPEDARRQLDRIEAAALKIGAAGLAAVATTVDTPPTGRPRARVGGRTRYAKWRTYKEAPPRARGWQGRAR